LRNSNSRRTPAKSWLKSSKRMRRKNSMNSRNSKNQKNLKWPFEDEEAFKEEESPSRKRDYRL
jgi:hypothetical protein